MPSLKEFIDNHPLKVIVAAVISTTGFVGGAFTWHFNKEKDQFQSQLKIEQKAIADANSKKIEELSDKIRSIDRRVGDEKLYFDVATLPVRKSEIEQIPSRYMSYDGGKFFVERATDDRWSYSKTNELDYTKMLFPPEAFGASGALLEQLSHNEIFLWKGSGQFKAKFGDLSINLFPNIVLTRIDMDRLRKMGKAFKEDYDKANLAQDSIKILSELLENSSKHKEQSSDASLNENEAKQTKATDTASTGDGDKAKPAISTTEEKVQSTSDKDKIFEQLSRLFNQDLIAIMFVDKVMSAFMVGQTAPAKVSVVTTEKKANILYMKFRFDFDSVEVPNAPIIYSEEYFLLVL